MGRTVNPAIPAIAPEVAAILAIVARSGIVLEPRGDKLRYHPRSAMTQELAARIKANKAELLALLQRNDPLTATDKTPTPQRANSPHGTRSGVLSVLSVSEQGKGLWCEEELGLLAHAEKTPSDLPRPLRSTSPRRTPCPSSSIPVILDQEIVRIRFSDVL